MLDQYKFHDMTFTWLEGPQVLTDGGTLFGPVPRGLWGRYFPFNDDNQIPNGVDPILVTYQEKHYLIDTGLGLDKLSDKVKRNLGVKDEGDIEGSLNALGLSREDIDGVLMTHMHNDHAGGLTYREGDTIKSTYPKATIYIQEDEWDDVRKPSRRTRNTYLKDNWEAIVPQVQTYADTFEVSPGIILEHTGGHSRGHAIIRFEQAGETLYHLADLLLTHVHTNPLWVGGVDDYPMTSIEAKERLMDELLPAHQRVLFYHDPYYRVIEYTPDGKNIAWALKNSRTPLLDPTDQQDKRPIIIQD